MNASDVELIRIVATQFRGAMEKCDFKALEPLKRRCRTFPVGACGDTCELLGTHFYLTLGLELNYANGWRTYSPESSKSHAWLELEGLIVDITADQFSDNPHPVIVTNDRTWHSLFTCGQAPRVAGFHLMNKQGRKCYEPAYELICKALAKLPDSND